jgi:hypothetical protein
VGEGFFRIVLAIKPGINAGRWKLAGRNLLSEQLGLHKQKRAHSDKQRAEFQIHDRVCAPFIQMIKHSGAEGRRSMAPIKQHRFSFQLSGFSVSTFLIVNGRKEVRVKSIGEWSVWDTRHRTRRDRESRG